MFGKSYQGLFGTDGFFFSSSYGPYQVYFVYQTMFVATAVTLVSGAITERVKFEGYLIITLIIAGIIYPITGHWAWNSEVLGDMMQPGWLRQKGFYDYAGSTIVHSVGGWVAFAALSIIGPWTYNGQSCKGNPPSNRMHNCTSCIIIKTFLS